MANIVVPDNPEFSVVMAEVRPNDDVVNTFMNTLLLQLLKNDKALKNLVDELESSKAKVSHITQETNINVPEYMVDARQLNKNIAGSLAKTVDDNAKAINDLKSGDVKDNVVSFTTATTRTELASGRKLSVLFGQVAKWLGDLKSFVFNNLETGTSSTSTTSALSASVGKVLNDKIEDHVGDVNNPHSVNKSHVGLGNVDNTADIDKPISRAQQNELNGKAPNNHASSDARYGLGSSDVYGHLKVSDVISSWVNFPNQGQALALSQFGGYDLYVRTQSIGSGLNDEITNRTNADVQINNALVAFRDSIGIASAGGWLKRFQVNYFAVDEAGPGIPACMAYDAIFQDGKFMRFAFNGTRLWYEFYNGTELVKIWEYDFAKPKYPERDYSTLIINTLECDALNPESDLNKRGFISRYVGSINTPPIEGYVGTRECMCLIGGVGVDRMIVKSIEYLPVTGRQWIAYWDGSWRPWVNSGSL